MSRNALGTLLRAARVERGMSLRDVERATGIDNAHLSQLETGRIRKPDLSLLWELAAVYERDFEEFLQVTGRDAGGGSITVAMRALGELSEDERQDVIAYMARLKRDRGGDA